MEEQLYDISSYSRSDMIADGLLIDVSKLARQIGFKIPVALTLELYEGYICPDEKASITGENITGRVWDTLWICYLAARGKGRDSNEIHFRVCFKKGGFKKEADLKAVCHPGDDEKPVITIDLLKKHKN